MNININKHNVKEYLNKYELKLVEDFTFLETEREFLTIKKNDIIRLLNKHTLLFNLGGKVEQAFPPHFLKLRYKQFSKVIYFSNFFIFYKEGKKTFRNKLEYLLDGLNNNTIKITKRKKD